MFDLVVIGSGPAGASAAYHASAAGMRVLLVDRAHFPRAKTCGDALSPRALAAIQRMGLPSLPGHPVYGMWMHQTRTRDSHYETFRHHVAPHHGIVVERHVLDHLLVQRAMAMGAEFLNATGRCLLERGGRVTGVVMETTSGTLAVSAQAVVGATGSSGVAFEARTGARTAWGVAARAYLRTVQDVGNDLDVYFPLRNTEDPLFGYGWLFPIGPREVNVGIGMIRTATAHGRSPYALLAEFIQQCQAEDPRLGGSSICSKAMSAPIAIGPPLGARTGFVPVGDLAGIANPFTGEGIAAAIESGELAARALVAGPDRAASWYAEALGRLLPRHASLDAALPRIYQKPGMLFDRGCDVVSSPESFPGAALRQLIWDDAPSPAPWSAICPLLARRTVESLRGEIIEAARRLRPLLGELLGRIIDDPRSAFGWCAAFTAAIRSDALGLDSNASADLRRVLLILEILNLVTRLHADLPPRGESADGRGTWGRKTLSLTLADALTAHALRRLYDLPAPWCRTVSRAAQTVFRLSVVAGSAHDASESGADVASPSRVLFRIAAATGLGEPDHPLPGQLQVIAHQLATWHRAPGAHHVHADAIRAVLLKGDAPEWKTSLEALVTTLAANTARLTPDPSPHFACGC